MKVCFFDFTTMVGGATKGSIYLLQRLKKTGVDVSVIDVYGNCKEYINDVEQANLPLSILNKKEDIIVIGHGNNKILRILEICKQTPSFLKILFNLIKKIREEKPDYIMVNNQKSLFFLVLARKFIEFKTIFYYRGEAKKNQISNKFIDMINTQVDVAYCHSMKAIENMYSYGVTKKINYLPNCISTKDVKKYLNSNKSSDHINILLSAGRIVKEKGYHTAIEAIGILNKKDYNLNLILPGLIVDSDYKLELDNLIIKYQLEKSVSFVGWVDNLTEILANVDYMVLPSYTEGFPRSIIEAMLLKIPVCATPVGGIPEAIFHKKTGYLFNVDNSVELAICLQDMLNDSEHTKILVNNAYDFAIATFNEDKNTQVFLDNLE